MQSRIKATFLLLFISLTSWPQNTFDSIIISRTKQLLPNDIVAYTFNYCDKNIEIKPYEVYEVLVGLKSYLKEHPNIKQWGYYYYHLANYFYYTDELDSALINYNKCLSSNFKLSFDSQLKSNLTIASIHTELGNIAKSFDLLNEIKEDAQNTNEPKFLGILLMHQATNYTSEENYSLASSQFQRAIDFFKESNDSIGMANAYSRLAKMYTSLGNYPLAVDYYEKAETIFRKANYKWLLAKNQLTIGKTYFMASQHANSLRYLVSAEALYMQFNSKKNLIEVYQAKGESYTAIRNFVQAEIYLNRALLITDEHNHINKKPEVLYNIGNLYYKQEVYKKAQKYYIQSLEIADKPNLKLGLYEKLSDINSKLNNYKKAYKYQVLHNGLQHNILTNEIKSKEERLNREFERQYVNSESEKSVLQKELSILLESKNKRQAFSQFSIAILLVVVLTLIIFLINQRKLYVKINKQLKETIRIQRDELNQNTQKFNQLNKSSERILNLSTKNIWEPFWVLENITNEIVNQEYQKNTNNKNKAFDDDQLIMARNLLENILYWSMNQQKQVELHPNSYSIEQILKPIVQTQAIRAKAKEIKLNYKQSVKNNLYLDKQTFQVALRNIIENAIKFSTHNGSITVDAKTVNKFIEIAVHDDGVGMTKEQIKSLYSNRKTHQASGTHGEKGIGLGLNLAKDFIELNFGKLNIESSVAYGTTVTIQLPIKS